MRLCHSFVFTDDAHSTTSRLTLTLREPREACPNREVNMRPSEAHYKINGMSWSVCPLRGLLLVKAKRGGKKKSLQTFYLNKFLSSHTAEQIDSLKFTAQDWASNKHTAEAIITFKTNKSSSNRGFFSHDDNDKWYTPTHTCMHENTTAVCCSNNCINPESVTLQLSETLLPFK